MNISPELFDVWISKVQTEIGIITTNNMLLELTNTELNKINLNNIDLIDALKIRILSAEKANQELKEIIKGNREK